MLVVHKFIILADICIVKIPSSLVDLMIKKYLLKMIFTCYYMTIENTYQSGYVFMDNKNILLNSKVPLATIICCCTLISCATIFLLLFAIHLIFPGYLGSFDQPFIIAKNITTDDEMTLSLLKKLINERTLLSIDDFWGYLGSFYQTIVTILIAVNAIIATFAFIIINNGSKEKAMEVAINHVQMYINSSEFSKNVSCAAADFLKNSRNDYSETTDMVEEKLEILEDYIERLEEYKREINKQISHIAYKVAILDTKDNKNDNYNLKME